MAPEPGLQNQFSPAGSTIAVLLVLSLQRLSGTAVFWERLSEGQNQEQASVSAMEIEQRPDPTRHHPLTDSLTATGPQACHTTSWSLHLFI
jgi:hypothetical protein